MRRIRATGFSILLLTACASAEEYRFTSEELGAFSPLMAGTLGATVCNHLIDETVATNFIKSKLGANVSFNAEGAAHIVWLAYGQLAMQTELGAMPKTKKDMARYCATMDAGFGANGTTIKGLFKN